MTSFFLPARLRWQLESAMQKAVSGLQGKAGSISRRNFNEIGARVFCEGVEFGCALAEILRDNGIILVNIDWSDVLPRVFKDIIEDQAIPCDGDRMVVGPA